MFGFTKLYNMSSKITTRKAIYRFFSDTYIENQIVMRKKYRFL